MKNLYVFLSLVGICLCSQAQIATTIDPRSIQLPQYANLTAIGSNIPAPQQGMMVYNQATATNWYYNGSNWVNLANATSTPAEPEGFGSWGCANHALKNYQPVGNLDGKNNDYFGVSVSISGDYAIVGASRDDDEGLTDNGSASIYKYNSSTAVWDFQTKLNNHLAASDDFFGVSVSISGDYAIVGAYGDDEEGLIDNGSASIYKRNSNTGNWNFQAKLTNPLASSNDYFGYSVCIAGEYAIIGAYTDDEEGLLDCGSASIFKRNANTGNWDFQTKLTNFSALNNDNYGYSVSISSDYAIVGVPNDDEYGLTNNGSANIYKRNPGSGAWNHKVKLTNFGAEAFDYFGWSVSISGDYAIVGADSDDEGGLTDNGSASIYRRKASSEAWDFQTRLTNTSHTGGGNFGSGVSISGDYSIMGTPNEDHGGLLNTGSSSISKRYGESWRLVSRTSDPGSQTSGENFGKSVAIDGSTGRFIIGAWGANIAVFGKVR
ncbi:MAG: hypothetical protein ACRCVT_13235 [Leadbetterella sp.]